MKLIKKLDRRLNKSGRKESWGEFLCPFCLQLVERLFSCGKRQQSCGCMKKELQSKALKGRKNSKEHKQKLYLANKGRKLKKEHKQKISKTRIEKGVAKGENNPMYGKKGNLSPAWNNGSSFEPYSPEFNKELKHLILERDNYTCQYPNCEHKSNTLDVHHIDYDKKNNNPKNLITLCHSCHSKTNGKNNRHYYIEYYQNIINNK